jgi:hypothetical protein
MSFVVSIFVVFSLLGSALTHAFSRNWSRLDVNDSVADRDLGRAIRSIGFLLLAASVVTQAHDAKAISVGAYGNNSATAISWSAAPARTQEVRICGTIKALAATPLDEDYPAPVSTTPEFVATNKVPTCHCFRYDTTVVMADGTRKWKRISEAEIGDHALTTDVETAENVGREVTELHQS